MDALELARLIVDVVEENKAQEIVLLDLRPNTVIADFFVLCNGNSERQIRALADYVRKQVRERATISAASEEGIAGSGWLVLDYGDVVLHIFSQEKRHYYDLEGLWSKNAQVLLSIQ